MSFGRPRSAALLCQVLMSAALVASPATSQQPAAQDSGRTAPPDSVHEPYSSWSEIDATTGGVLVGRTEFGEMRVGLYALVRFIDQQAQGSFTDHLGNEHPIDPRRDFHFHRAMIHFKGWVGSPKLRYQATAWSLMGSDQDVIYGYLGYQAHRRFNVYMGVNTIGGSRSMYGSHPFWLGDDRVMADEFFRGYFSSGVWINGELFPGFWYHGAVMDNLSILGVTAAEDTRDLSTGGGFWWMPTTKEFGVKGAFGDWEWHEKLATRLGINAAWSRESRMSPVGESPENTMLRMADARLIWETGALAPDVTVERADYGIYSADLGVKYRGVFLQGEYYRRLMDNFVADGPLPVEEIDDSGFYVQAAFFPIKQTLELYATTSWVFGDEDAGFDTAREYLGGANYYPFDSRNYRLNLQVIDVDRSPVSSVFGYYTGGQTGTTVSAAASVYF